MAARMELLWSEFAKFHKHIPNESFDKEGRQKRFKCLVCHSKTRWRCEDCDKPVCSDDQGGAGRMCYRKHILKKNPNAGLVLNNVTVATSGLSSSSTENNNQNHNNNNVLLSPTYYSYSVKDLVANYEQFKNKINHNFDEWKKEEEDLQRKSFDKNEKNEIRNMKRKHQVDNNQVNNNNNTNHNNNIVNNSNQNKVVTISAIQMTGNDLPESDIEGYYVRATNAIKEAVIDHNAQIVLLPELCFGPYFCQTIENDLFHLADPVVIERTNESNDENTTRTDPSQQQRQQQHAIIQRMQYLAKLYHVVLPISIYERCQQVFYNTVILIDNDGTIIGKYRKSHIPDGIGYQEKFYFTPGDTGIKVFTIPSLNYITIGIGICWDQWFPEIARIMTLLGADILLYPTAIGCEPYDNTIDTSLQWQRVMQGHSAANMIPIIASNRYGTEIIYHNDNDNNVDNDDNNINNGTSTKQIKQIMTFYGCSFITDNTGQIIKECSKYMPNGSIITSSTNNNNNKQNDNKGYEIITSTFDCTKNLYDRTSFGLFRDRRVDLYRPILTKDGSSTL